MRVSKAEVKYLRSLSQKKVREAEGKFLLEGWRALKEAINSPAEIDRVVVLPRFLTDPDYAKILGQLQDRNVPIKELSEAELKAVADTVHSQGVLAVMRQPKTELDDRLLRRASLVIAADGVSDPGNLGSILRSADWFKADLVLLGKGSVELFNEKVVRSTVGSIFHMAIATDVDLPSALGRLKRAGFSIITLSGDGKVGYAQHPVQTRTVFVLGNEAHGVSKDVRALSDAIVRIPRFGQAESLNVGVACGIVLAHFRTSRQEEGVH